MVNKTVLLSNLTKLINNPKLSKNYVSYICNFKDGHQYRHDEIETINELIDILKLSDDYLDGFIFGYEVPQLNKEFDLLKITKDKCLNIELKSHIVPEEKIRKQLVQNKHYLNMLSKRCFLISFVSENKAFYYLNENNELEHIDGSLLSSFVSSLGDSVEINLDDVFKPSNILVSPLNEADKFYNGHYLLTENQETIKQKILKSLDEGHLFFGLTGGPGTGKTLLLYDIAFCLAKSGKSVLIVHSGITCDGHDELNKKLNNLRIVWAKSLRYREMITYDIIAVDESQRIYTSIIEKIERWANKANIKCIFSFDESQKMSKAEERRNTPSLIKVMCQNYIFELTNKIRTNKEIALFITCLRDLSKYRKEYQFKNVSICYEPNNQRAVSIAKASEKDGYKYISYTTSYYDSALDYQESDTNTHRVIGQEFDGVVMILSNKFYYNGNLLTAAQHPNSDYLYTQLLYQGLTRTRTKLKLIVQTEELLEKIMQLFKR